MPSYYCPSVQKYRIERFVSEGRLQFVGNVFIRIVRGFMQVYLKINLIENEDYSMTTTYSFCLVYRIILVY